MIAFGRCFWIAFGDSFWDVFLDRFWEVFLDRFWEVFLIAIRGDYPLDPMGTLGEAWGTSGIPWGPSGSQKPSKNELITTSFGDVTPPF